MEHNVFKDQCSSFQERKLTCNKILYVRKKRKRIDLDIGTCIFKEYLKFFNRLYDITWFGPFIKRKRPKPGYIV